MMTMRSLLNDGGSAGISSIGEKLAICRGSSPNGRQAMGVVRDRTPARKYPLIDIEVLKTSGCRAMSAAEQNPPGEKPRVDRASGLAMLRRFLSTQSTMSFAMNRLIHCFPSYESAHSEATYGPPMSFMNTTMRGGSWPEVMSLSIALVNA